MEVRRLPIRLKVPSFSWAGPIRICSSVPFCAVRTRAPRGSDGWNVAMPQWKPWPGASNARASGEPIITASAPHAIAFATSPPVRMPPSAMTLQYSPVSSMCCERAAATSAMAVACGTPMPSTPREVQAGGVRRAATHDAGHRHLGDELLEVERFGLRGDVLRRDHRALDHEDVE